MRQRFNKASFFRGRVPYGHMLPQPPVLGPIVGDGQRRARVRLALMVEAHPPIPEVPETRQIVRRLGRKLAKRAAKYAPFQVMSAA